MRPHVTQNMGIGALEGCAHGIGPMWPQCWAKVPIKITRCNGGTSPVAPQWVPKAWGGGGLVTMWEGCAHTMHTPRPHRMLVHT